jgi:hypothetical protein
MNLIAKVEHVHRTQRHDHVHDQEREHTYVPIEFYRLNYSFLFNCFYCSPKTFLSGGGVKASGMEFLAGWHWKKKNKWQ